MDLRISSGEYKNTKLKVADESRPVKEHVKLAVFSKISDLIEKADVLDLFAGSGNLGFEALSRGAKHVDMIEVSGNAQKAIQDNIKKLAENFSQNFDDTKISLFKKDAIDYVTNEYANYDVIFADPPYETPTNHLIKMIDNMMKKDSIFIYFHESTKKYDVSELNPNLKLLDSRKYGVTTVDFIQLV